ncbi:MAG: hypothetical protein WC911_02225, partial [Thermoleophilia bacterium]
LLPDGTPQVYPALVSEGDKVLAKTSRDRAPLFASSLPSAPMSALHTFLTGDGIDDPVKADARRIRALPELLPGALQATESDIKALGSDDMSLVGKGLLEAEKAIREALNASALQSERTAAENAGIATAKSQDIARLVNPPEMPLELAPLTEEDLAALKESGSNLRSTASVTRERANRRADLERARDSQTPRPKPEELDSDISALDTSSTQVLAKIEETQAEIDRLKAILEGYQTERRGYDARAKELRKQRSDRVTEAARWDEAQKSYAGIPDLPTIADADKAEQVLADALAHYEQVKRAKDIQTKRKEHAETLRTLKEAQGLAKEASENAQADGKRLRVQAAAVSSKIGAILAAKGIPAGLTIVDGRLYASVDGKVKLFADPRGLSDGQRMSVMLHLGLAAFPGRIIPIDGKWLAELQPSSVAELARLAVEKGVIILSARPSDGELAMEWRGE